MNITSSARGVDKEALREGNTKNKVDNSRGVSEGRVNAGRVNDGRVNGGEVINHLGWMSSENFLGAEREVSVIVRPRVEGDDGVAIEWADPTPIVYGHTLTVEQLDAVVVARSNPSLNPSLNPSSSRSLNPNPGASASAGLSPGPSPGLGADAPDSKMIPQTPPGTLHYFLPAATITSTATATTTATAAATAFPSSYHQGTSHPQMTSQNAGGGYLGIPILLVQQKEQGQGLASGQGLAPGQGLAELTWLTPGKDFILPATATMTTGGGLSAIAGITTATTITTAAVTAASGGSGSGSGSAHTTLTIGGSGGGGAIDTDGGGSFGGHIVRVVFVPLALQQSAVYQDTIARWKAVVDRGRGRSGSGSRSGGGGEGGGGSPSSPSRSPSPSPSPGPGPLSIRRTNSPSPSRSPSRSPSPGKREVSFASETRARSMSPPSGRRGPGQGPRSGSGQGLTQDLGQELGFDVDEWVNQLTTAYASTMVSTTTTTTSSPSRSPSRPHPSRRLPRILQKSVTVTVLRAPTRVVWRPPGRAHKRAVEVGGWSTGRTRRGVLGVGLFDKYGSQSESGSGSRTGAFCTYGSQSGSGSGSLSRAGARSFERLCGIGRPQ